jgi:hypothetical protein
LIPADEEAVQQAWAPPGFSLVCSKKICRLGQFFTDRSGLFGIEEQFYYFCVFFGLSFFSSILVFKNPKGQMRDLFSSGGSFHGKDLHFSFLYFFFISSFSSSFPSFFLSFFRHADRFVFRAPRYLPHTTGCSLPGRVNAYRLESKFVLVLCIWNPSIYFSFCNVCAFFSNRTLV